MYVPIYILYDIFILANDLHFSSFKLENIEQTTNSNLTIESNKSIVNQFK